MGWDSSVVLSFMKRTELSERGDLGELCRLGEARLRDLPSLSTRDAVNFRPARARQEQASKR